MAEDHRSSAADAIVPGKRFAVPPEQRDFADALILALAHTITARYWMSLGEDDVHWTLTDTGWAKAAWGLLYPPLLAGAAVVLYDGEGFDPEMHLKLIAEHRVTTFCAPPTI